MIPQKKPAQDTTIISAPTAKALFALVHGIPWRSLRIVKTSGQWQAVATTWKKVPGRAQA